MSENKSPPSFFSNKDIPSHYPIPFLNALLSCFKKVAITITNSEGLFLYWNEGARELFGYEAEEVIGFKNSNLLYDPRQELPPGERKRIRSLLDRGETFHGNFTELDKEGRRLYVSKTVVALPLEKDNPPLYLTLRVDRTEEIRLRERLAADQQKVDEMVEERLTEIEMSRDTFEMQAIDLAQGFDEMLFLKQELEKKEQELRESNSKLTSAKDKLRTLSITDGLTGLFNRRHFNEELEKEYSRCQRHDKTLVLIILDIDHFKNLNDTYGHPFGDEVLVTVANTLQKNLRKGDVIARYGGEEFVLLLPESSLCQGEKVAEKMRKAVAELPFAPKGLQVTISLGVAQTSVKEERPSPIEELLKEADTALYQSKEGGRNRTTLYQKVS